jgi:hypothetical protein
MFFPPKHSRNIMSVKISMWVTLSLGGREWNIYIRLWSWYTCGYWYSIKLIFLRLLVLYQADNLAATGNISSWYSCGYWYFIISYMTTRTEGLLICCSVWADFPHEKRSFERVTTKVEPCFGTGRGVYFLQIPESPYRDVNDSAYTKILNTGQNKVEGQLPIWRRSGIPFAPFWLTKSVDKQLTANLITTGPFLGHHVTCRC